MRRGYRERGKVNQRMLLSLWKEVCHRRDSLGWRTRPLFSSRVRIESKRVEY